MLRIENLVCIRSGKPILDNFSCRFEEGFTAILGRNGAGKSTLLRCIDRFFPVQKGDITWNGNSFLKLKASELARLVAFIPQNTIIRDETVLDAVLSGAFPLSGLFPQKKHLSIAKVILEKLNVSSLAMRKTDGLSGGEKQKVALARALMQQTDILLLDEITSDLDIKNQMETMALLRNIASEGKTVIAVLHDVNLAYRFCDRFVLIKEGRCLFEGTKSQITAEMLSSLYQVNTVPQTNGKGFLFTENYETE